MKNLLFISVLFFASCKTASMYQTVQGHYFTKGKDYQYDLLLNNDSTFVLTEKYFEINSVCKGKWQFLSENAFLLKCDEANLSEKLQSGYMTERERKVVVLNKKKLKISKVILKRKL